MREKRAQALGASASVRCAGARPLLRTQRYDVAHCCHDVTARHVRRLRDMHGRAREAVKSRSTVRIVLHAPTIPRACRRPATPVVCSPPCPRTIASAACLLLDAAADIFFFMLDDAITPLPRHAACLRCFAMMLDATLLSRFFSRRMLPCLLFCLLQLTPPCAVTLMRKPLCRACAAAYAACAYTHYVR